MEKFDICTCYVDMDGGLNIRHRDEHNPVTWAELMLLQFMFGDRAVSKIRVIGDVERTQAEESFRLRERYGNIKFAECYPGARPNLPTTAPKGLERVKKPLPAKKPVPEKAPI